MEYAPNRKLSDVEIRELIEAHRNRSFAMAMSRVRAWGAPLSRDEVRSLADLAVCEAARGFRPEIGTFETYLFYYVRKELLKTIDRAVHHGAKLKLMEDYSLERQAELGEPSQHDCQETMYYRKQLKNRCFLALRVLTDLERSVITGTVFEEEPVTTVARRLGYSRGHLSEVKKNAIGKLRRTLKAAA